MTTDQGAAVRTTRTHTVEDTYDRPPPPLAYTLQDQQRAWDAVGSNCGPGAIAGICGITLDDSLAAIPDFPARKYTTEIMLRDALRRLDVAWADRATSDFPDYGISRIQWDGPWMASHDKFVPLAHSHWVGSWRSAPQANPLIFDHNAISQGGWITLTEWATHLVPWLLRTCEPEATGHWTIIDVLEIERPLPSEKT